jgi:putative PIN family toxin of toxin-antitoxin system
MPKSTKRELKLVLDSNVWISGLIWDGTPGQILRAAQEDKLWLLISEEILAEISRVLDYPKIKNDYEPAGRSREDIIALIVMLGTVVQVTQRVDVVNEHPADNKVIESALAGKADYLISGDKHLLKLGSYKKIKILYVKDFLKQL